ncbi:MAG: hypothetical protein ACREB0_09965, partial [Sphingopyxis sp.]
GLALALCLAAVGMGVGESGLLFLIIALAMPFLAIQDALRYVAFANREAAKAAAGDVTWLVGFLVAGSLLPDNVGPAAILGVWSMAGIASIIVMSPRLAVVGIATHSRWLRDSASIARWYLPDYVMVLATTVAPSLLVGWMAGVAEVGGLRLALSYLGPISILWAAAANLFTPALADARRSTIGVEVALSGIAALAVGVWTLVGLSVPNAIGRRVVGASWPNARGWMPGVGVGYTALATYSGAVVGLRARNAGRRIARARWTTAPLALGLPPLLYVRFGPAGFGVGVAASALATAALLWMALRTVASGLGVQDG